jgi:hypothetical protein
VRLRIACPGRHVGVVANGIAGPGSGDGERVIARLGQDVAALPDDLAGF